jgi:hypothetical protein
MTKPAPIWPGEILDFKGVPDFPPFESHRDELTPPSEDPLARTYEQQLRWGGVGNLLHLRAIAGSVWVACWVNCIAWGKPVAQDLKAHWTGERISGRIHGRLLFQ